jgi:hypothetical protein
MGRGDEEGFLTDGRDRGREVGEEGGAKSVECGAYKRSLTDGKQHGWEEGMKKGFSRTEGIADGKWGRRVERRAWSVAREETAERVERARVLAARAELAVALGEEERLAAVRAELGRIELTEEERLGLGEELGAAEALERWLTTGIGGAEKGIYDF